MGFKAKPIATIQVSIDGFRLIADRTGCYAPSREPSYTYDKDGKLESATAHIKNLQVGVWHEVSATAFLKNIFKKIILFGKNAASDVSKTAEALVLRRAFPANLSGLYTDDEMGTSINRKLKPFHTPNLYHLLQLQPQPVNEKTKK